MTLLSVAALATTACDAGAGGGPGGQPIMGHDDSLAGVCPKTVVIQSDWEPEAEYGPLYELIGRGYTIDSYRKSVTGPLVSGNQDTGVKVEIRSGGPAIGFQTVSTTMYLDKSIVLGQISTDGAVRGSTAQPTVAVVAPMRKSPQTLMWDPRSHPGWKTIADIGRSDAKIVYSPGEIWADYLVAEGIVKRGQLDSSYDGSPARFVADAKNVTQEGFATAEPYVYQHQVRAWAKPVAYQLIADTGWDAYPETLAARTGDLAADAPCLRKLVPIVQRAVKDYLASPAAANELLVGLVTAYDTGFAYSGEVADYADTLMPKLGIVGNEDGTLGKFDAQRVQHIVDTVTPLLAGDGNPVKPGLTGAQLFTNQFIDPAIALPH
jgi:hypothetical protein